MKAPITISGSFRQFSDNDLEHERQNAGEISVQLNMLKAHFVSEMLLFLFCKLFLLLMSGYILQKVTHWLVITFWQ
jgi:hypothetical protein